MEKNWEWNLNRDFSKEEVQMARKFIFHLLTLLFKKIAHKKSLKASELA